MANTFVPRMAEVEAVYYDGSNHEEIRRFADKNVTILHEEISNTAKVNVHTNNGTVELLPGHWLVSGAYDFYPCDNQTFVSRWQVRASAEVPAELLETDDAMAWAVAFEEMKMKHAWDQHDIDPSLMVGWFANAMAAGVTGWQAGDPDGRGRTVNVPKNALPDTEDDE